MLTSQPTLNEREWQLIMQLLEAEQRELPVEIRRTESREYNEALEQRRSMVEDLVQRLKDQGITSS